MKVHELIEKLQQFDQNAEVLSYHYDDFAVGDGDHYSPAEVSFENGRVVIS